tara:strand:- start:44946 stop:45893 length:948 start_codon:yes stop_codon:yes gene_type:complete
MYSNFYPWDFVKNVDSIIDPRINGLYSLLCYDPFIEKIILNKVDKSKNEFQVLSGLELTVDWLEDNINTLDFFSQGSSYIVILADQMAKNVKEFIIEGKLNLEDKHFLLCFNSDSKSFDEIKKSVEGTFFKVDPPRFWEGQKLLQFLANEMNIRLNYNSIQTILDKTPQDAGDLLRTLKNLSLEFGDLSKLDPKKIEEFLESRYLDQFSLAKSWGDRNWSKYSKKLIELSHDFDALRSFANFMQGHLFKVLDPSYISKKSRSTKYDDQILNQSRSWDNDEVLKEIDFYTEVELLSKSRDENIKNVLRTYYLEKLA